MTMTARLRAYILGLVTLICVAIGTTDGVQAQTVPDPNDSTLPTFPCSGDIYQVQSGQLRIFDPITSSYTNVGTNQGSYNATGFNVVDGYAYASQSGNIIRIGADGETEIVYNIGFGTFSGDLDRSNNFYLRRNNNRYDRVDLATGAITTLNFSGVGGGPADVAFIPGGGDSLVGFSGGQMYTYNLTSLQKTRVNVSGGMPGGGYGATWTDASGRLFTFNNNTGLLFEIFDYDTNAPTAVQVGVGVPSGNNDGFSCAEANFPNLPPLAQDDGFSTPVNAAITGDVTADNGNGVDNDPDGGTLTVTGPDSGPSDGTLVLNSDGTFTYTPDTYFLGTDTFTYTVTDPAGLMATATVTIDVTGDVGFEVDKRRISGVAVATEEGEVINYQIEVENTGDIPLTNINIVDTLPNGTAGTLTGPVEGGGTDGRDQVGRIDVGETWIYTISYTVEQGDIDGGGPLVNTVAVTTDETGTDVESDTALVPVDQDDGFAFTKTTDVPSFAAVGDPVVFTFEVENTGNVTLTDVVVTDPFFDPDYSCTIASVAPGVTDDTTCTFTYNVTQDDIDAGEIVNTAAANANGSGGAALPEQTSTVTLTGPAEVAAVRVVKSDEGGDLAFGPVNDTETFTFEVFNDGDVTLTNLTLDDPTLAFSCALADLAPGTSTTVCANGDALTADLSITQPLVDASSFTNTVTVTGTTTQGTDVSDDDTLVLNGPAQDVQLTMVKSITGGDNYAAIGDVITYSYEVTNTGNITLTSPITVADDRTTVSCPVLPAGGLAPQASIVCSASYAVTQTDLDAGDVVNLATASVTQTLADGSTVTETSPQVSATATADSAPAITIAKTLTSITDEDGTPQGTLTYDEVDDVLNYTFTVTNAGNVTLTDTITVNDGTIGATVTCATAPVNLAPGDSVTCTASYPVTQPDLNAGSFVNSATAATTFGGNPVTTPTPASTTAFAQQEPALTLVKTETPPSVTVLTVGGTISYTYVSTNSGNVTLTDPITIDDDRFPAGGVTCPTFPAAGVPPGGTYTCTADYTITSNDVFIGTVVNNATATSGTTTSPPASVTVPSGSTPALEVDKTILSISDPVGGTASGLQFNEVGDVLTFQFEVRNTGTVAFTRPVTVTDPMLTPNPITCYTPSAGDPDFQPGETATCTGEYTITQTDLDAGEVFNTGFASVEYNEPGQGPSIYNSPAATETVTAVGDPELTVAKDVTAGPEPADADDDLTYTITATNSGNQTLSNVSLSDPLIPDLTCTVGGAAAPANVVLEPGEVLSCTGDYTVTQADVDGQTLTNTATATGLAPNGGQVTGAGSDTHPLDAPDPEMEIIKTLTAGTPSPAYNAEDDTVSFTVEVRNTGNVTLTTIDVTDTLVPGTCTVGPLAPGESDDTCRFVYTVEQSDVDAGEINNTASGLATPIASSGAAPIIRTGLLTTPGPTRTPGITLTKTADLTSFNADMLTITYTFDIENTGNITLTGAPAINDPDATGINCDALPPTGLLPGEVVSCTGTYETEQGDLDAGQIVNTATASMPNPLDPGTPLTSTASVTVPAIQTPSISLAKTPGVANFTGANQTITYTYVITNTGNVTLTAAPDLTDDRIPEADLSCDPVPAGGLLPLGTLQCLGTYETTQPDVDAGSVTNIAEVQIDDPTNPGTPLTAGATATVPALRNAVIEVIKTPSATTGVAEGDTIIYSYVVTNRGNVTLTNIVLDDQHTSASGTAPLAIGNGGVVLSLDPLESATLTAQYVVTQADVDAGVPLTNTVTASATPPAGITPPSDSDGASVSLATALPELTVLKDVPNLPALLVAGTDVTFRIRVQNTGNVTLDNVVLTDTLGRLDGSVISMPPPSGPVQDTGIIGALDVGEIWEYALTYTLTQEDVDAGGISNSVLAEATDPSGTPVEDLSDETSPTGDDPTLVQISAAPSLEAIKTITTPATTVGAQVVFQIAVENTGNVTLTSVGISSDTVTRLDGSAVTGAINGPTFANSSAGSPSGTLVPGETAFYSLTYTLTQEDVDAGGVQNTATATGTPPSGGPIEDISDDDGIGESNPTVQTIPPALGLTLDKQLASGGPTFDDITDVLTYDFIVTNTSNVTLTDPIVIDDPLIIGAGGSVICPPGPLAPDGIVTCQGSYTITQPNLNDGFVTNSATAASSFEGTPVTSGPAEVTVPASQEPALSLLKEADPLDPVDFVVGATVSYTYTVTNTGNVTLIDPVAITDDRIEAPDIDCPTFPAAGLAPNDVYVCTGTYDVTIDDVDVGSIVNNATATSGTTISPPASETTPNGATPALEIVKTLASVTDVGGTVRPSGAFLAVDDILNYSFTVTNTGTRAFVGDIDVVDPLLPGGRLNCWTRIPGTDEDFTAGETATCTGSYDVTQADLDAGEVINIAFASTSFGSIPTIYNSPTDTEIAPGSATPSIAFDKRVISAPITAVGQTITYEFEVENTGNQTLTNVSVTDPLLPGLVCTIASLAPGDSLTCAEDYTVQQTDIDEDTLTNTATATGTTPAGTSVTETDTEITNMPAAMPMMTLDKTGSPDPFGPLGSDILYTFTVENTGNVTLRNIVVTDPLDPTYSCTVPDLAPGESNSGCTLTYQVMQGDVDAAQIINTATVSATPDRGMLTPVSTTITTPGPTPAPQLELTKTSSVDFLGDGGTVTYTFTVENTGTVTLEPPTISDTMTRLDGSPGGTIGALSAPVESGLANNLLEVGEVWTYTATYTITLDDVNAGGFENSATANALDLLGNGASDVSDDGDDGDGDTTGDPTRIEITSTPSLEVEKVVTTPGLVATDVVVFTITAQNTGNVSLTAPDIADTLTQIDGTSVGGTVGAPVLISGNAAGINPGEAWVWELSYTLTQDDVDAGGLSNTATVTGTPPTGPAVSDISRDGDPADGNIADDPTELAIERTPGIEVIKTLISAGDAVGETVVYDIEVRNTGNVTLTGLTLTGEDLTNFDGSALTPDSIVQTIGDPAGLLPVNGTSIFRVTYSITQNDINAGGVLNSATFEATSPTGAPVADISDTGLGNGSTPTPAPINQIDELTVSKTAAVPIRIGGTLTQVEFEIEIENTGNVTQTGIEVVDDLTGFVAPATLVDVDTPAPTGLNGAAGNTAYDGDANTLVLDGAVDLDPGQGGTITLTVRYDIAGGNPASPNTVAVSSDRITVPVTATALVAGITAEPDLFATKAASPQTAILGDTITYTMTFENRLTTAEGALTLIDELPPGLEFTPGTATFNGAATPAPIVVGRQLQWPGVTIGPSETITIALQARITGGESGELTNRAFIVAADGSILSNVASATVTRRAEALFDCADIIGRVFDDRDFDGVFDEGSEEGLPRVRLVTVDGTLITTDEHGRFSVPCAALPRGDIGSNFQLELDDRTLPTGFFVTTENPRILRVTPGTMTVFNFGATFGQLIEIDLTAAAFQADGRPTDALEQGIDRLIQVLNERPSVLELDYFRGDESVEIARRNLEEIQTLIEERWRRAAQYELRIVTSIERIH